MYNFHKRLIHVPNTVSGPSPERASTKPAAVTAATRVEKSGLPTAMSTIPWHSGMDMDIDISGMDIDISSSGSVSGSSSAGGRRTASMTWITPLQAIISGMITLESLILTPSSKLTVTEAPLSVSTSPLTRSVLRTSAATTWYVRMPVSASIFSGRRRVSTVASGRAAKASLVGAIVISKNRH